MVPKSITTIHKPFKIEVYITHSGPPELWGTIDLHTYEPEVASFRWKQTRKAFDALDGQYNVVLVGEVQFRHEDYYDKDTKYGKRNS